MIFVFEDNSKSPLSNLIQVSAGAPCVFSGSSAFLASQVRKLNVHDSIVVFVDLPLGNDTAYATYRSLVMKWRSYENLLIIPVICAEAVLLKSLIAYPELSSNVFKDLSFTDLLKHCINDTNESLEQVSKRALNLFSSSYFCLKNRSSARHVANGKFYLNDCGLNCDALACQACPFLNKELSLYDKSTNFWTYMPVRLRIDSTSETQGTDKEAILNLVNIVRTERKNMYIALCNDLGIPVPYWVNHLIICPFYDL